MMNEFDLDEYKRRVEELNELRRVNWDETLTKAIAYEKSVKTVREGKEVYSPYETINS